MRADGVSAKEARWLAIAAQGLGRPRPTGPVRIRHLRDAVNGPGIVQLDAISVLARTQFLALFSRVGAYDTALLHKMAAPMGAFFEVSGYRAALMPMSAHPLLRWRQAHLGAYLDNAGHAARWEAYHQVHADYIAAVRREVEDRGPLAASQLSDPRRRAGEWWERRSDGRRALEYLFASGRLAAWRTPSFERVYDLPERVIPVSVLALPTPSPEAAQRELLRLAARSSGVATVADLAGYYLLKPATAKVRVAELVDAGDLVRVEVEGWREPGYVPADVRLVRPQRVGATLVSPFDSLIWDRRRTRRLFGFDYRIEVYVPEPKREYGYYVLPLLHGDRLAGRFDLKADRKRSTLRVVGAYVEADADMATVAAAAATELAAMSEWLGLESVAIEPKGNLAAALYSR